MPPRSWMANGLQILGGGILLLAVLIAPWLIAGVTSKSQWWLFSAIGVAGALWTMSIVWTARREGGPAISVPSILWPMVAYLALGLFQLWPLRGTSVDGKAPAVPRQLPWVEMAVDGEGQGMRESPREVLGAFRSVSTLSPASTRFALARLTFAVVAAFLSAQLFSDSRRANWLWGGVAVNGVALAFFGFVQMLTWNGKLFWTIPLELGGQPFSTFVNRNNAAGYLNLCLVGGIVLFTTPSVVDEDSRDEPSWDDCPSDRSGLRTIWIASGMSIAAIVAGILASASRGGALGLICGSAVVGLLSIRRGLLSKSLVGLVALTALTVATAVWTGAADRLRDRLSSAPPGALYDNGRWAHWRDALSVVHDFPMTGTGLGTYRFAALPYQTHPSDMRYVNADNQFVETLVEGGVCGLACVFVTIVLLIAVIRRMGRSSGDARRSGLVLAGGYLVVSQSVCGFFDFGPIVTANMLTLAVLVGSLCGHSERTSGGRRGSLGDACFFSMRSIGGIGVVLVLLAAGGLGLREVRGVARLDDVRARVPSLDGPDAFPDAELARVLDELDTVETDNPEVHQFAADLWAHRFRLETFAQVRRADPQRPAADIWDATQLPLIHRQANEWAQSGQLERLHMLENDSNVRALLVPCVARLHRAIECCPFVPRSDLMLGSLAFVRSTASVPSPPFMPDTPAGLDETYRGLRIAPTLQRSLLIAAELFDASGRLAEAQACWKRCVTLYPLSLPRVHRRVFMSLSLDEELHHILPDSASLLLDFARAELMGEHQSAERETVGKRMLVLLAQTEASQSFPDAKSHLQAMERYRLKAGAWELRGDYDATILSLRQSISHAPLEADPRVELARVFQRMGRLSEAREQALIAASLRPRDVEARRLLNDLQRIETRVRSTKSAP